MFSWTIDGVDQLFQKWFWLNIGSNTAPTSFDTLSTPIGLSLVSSSNATISYFPQGLSVNLGFALAGGAQGSGASYLAESVTIQNTNNNPIVVHVFAYSDFDLAGASEGDTVAFPTTNTVVQQGKGVTMTETVQAPTPDEWEASWYDLILEILDDGSPSTLSDALIPQAPGDQTFAYQWDETLAAGQTLTINLTDSVQSALVLLTITLSGNNVVISWPTNGTSSLQLNMATALGSDANWDVVTNRPVPAGEFYQVILPRSIGAQFFRLEP